MKNYKLITKKIVCCFQNVDMYEARVERQETKKALERAFCGDSKKSNCPMLSSSKGIENARKVRWLESMSVLVFQVHLPRTEDHIRMAMDIEGNYERKFQQVLNDIDEFMDMLMHQMYYDSFT